MTTHAQLSPSGASRWMTCPGSVVLGEAYPDTGSNEYAAEGTAAHELASWALTEGTDTVAYLGRKIVVEEFTFVVDQDMADYVQQYVDNTRAIGGELFVEQRLSIEHLTGEEGAHGTSDAVIIAGTELVIRDLKYGQGVKVYAPGNHQLRIYALAALAEYELTHDIQTVRMCIDMPRLAYVSEDVMTVDALLEFGKTVARSCERVRAAVQYAENNPGEMHEKYFAPSEDACRWCPVKPDCPALRNHVLTTVADDFVDVTEPIEPQINVEREFDNDTLGNLMAAIPLIEDWCKAIRAKTESELLAGHPVPGFKLVEGKRGNRAWADQSQAEEVLKSMRLKMDEMYDLKLISPTTAEKLHKSGKIGPRQWPRLQDHITRADGKPSVAPETDDRPALVVTATEDEFDDETACDLV
ncbi:DUF2800 domain-containing protein [Alcaligenaceae bacterium]|nr:DUF2800 domain-containing protein [Alcaligenaceae bacterium]